MHGCVDNGYRKWMREGRRTKPWFVLSWYLWVMSRTEVHQMLTRFQWCALLVFSPADRQHIGLQACSCTRNVWMQFQVEWLHNLDSVRSLPPIPHWRAKYNWRECEERISTLRCVPEEQTHAHASQKASPSDCLCWPLQHAADIITEYTCTAMKQLGNFWQWNVLCIQDI